jgi:restriction system protein
MRSNSKQSTLVTKRQRERRELRAHEVWVGDSEWYLDLTDYTLTHDGEKIATCYSVSPTILLKTELVKVGDRTPEGDEIQGPTATWFEISKQLRRDPEFRFEFTAEPIKLEEYLAGAYKLHGWDAVTLTPRSGDKGRDVIAITSQMSATRVLDQAKAYSPTNLVSQNDVRAIFGVLCKDPGATKGIITTTSDFAPGVAEEFQKEIPYRLETKNGQQFLEWIQQILAKQGTEVHGTDPKWIEPPPGLRQPIVVPHSRRQKAAKR